MDRETVLDDLAADAIQALPLARRTPANVEFLQTQPEEVVLQAIKNDKDLQHNERLQDRVQQFQLHFYGTVYLTVNNYYSDGQHSSPSHYGYHPPNHSPNYLPAHPSQYSPPNINIDVTPSIYVEGSKSNAKSNSSQDNNAQGGMLVVGAVILALFLSLLLGASD